MEQTRMRLRHIWAGMKARTTGSGHKKDRRNYYERGIRLCEEWQDFDVFFQWSILNGYESHLQIDRINNDGNYEPSNCRWVDCSVQANNRRNNQWITHNGETLSARQWADRLGITEANIYSRLHRGVALPDLLFPGKMPGGPKNPPTGDNHWSRKKPNRVPEGTRHWSSRLSEDQVREIRSKYSAGGVMQKDLAAEYGVSRDLINCIVHRKTYKHIS